MNKPVLVDSVNVLYVTLILLSLFAFWHFTVRENIRFSVLYFCYYYTSSVLVLFCFCLLQDFRVHSFSFKFTPKNEAKQVSVRGV